MNLYLIRVYIIMTLPRTEDQLKIIPMGCWLETEKFCRICPTPRAKYRINSIALKYTAMEDTQRRKVINVTVIQAKSTLLV